MSYTPMSDLGQQGLFDITRTLLQQPDLASLSEALSQLVKRSALSMSLPKPGRSLPRAASTLNLVITVCFL